MPSDNNAQGEAEDPMGVVEVPKNDEKQKYEREIEKEIAKSQLYSEQIDELIHDNEIYKLVSETYRR